MNPYKITMSDGHTFTLYGASSPDTARDMAATIHHAPESAILGIFQESPRGGWSVGPDGRPRIVPGGVA